MCRSHGDLVGTVLVLPPSSGDSDKPGCDLLCHTLGLVPGPTLSSGAGRCPPDHQIPARNPSAVCSSLGRDSRPFLPGLQSRGGRTDPTWLEFGAEKANPPRTSSSPRPSSARQDFFTKGAEGKTPKQNPFHGIRGRVTSPVIRGLQAKR